ncbi:MAG: hypothetical protein KA210_02795 [Bacteroidia bacterium]|jgi:hypothetical protein|nr:hypothetical protein [Bacteroidia bacterium]
MKYKEFKYKNINYKLDKVDLKLYLYLFCAFIFLITVGISAVKGEINFEFYADSETYMEFMLEKQSFTDIILFNTNMFGPTVILTVLKESYFAVFFFNVFIVLFSYFTFTKNYKVDKSYFLFCLILSPMFFSSIISINKEIISLLSLALFFKFHKTKSVIVLILSILVSFLVRWQMTVFIFSLMILLSSKTPFKNNKKKLIFIYLISVSILYFINLSSFEQFNRIAELGQESSDEGSGLFSVVLSIQNSGILGYFFAFIPKFLFLFIGLISRYYKLFDFSDFYNNFVVFLQAVANFVILKNVFNSKISFNNIFFFSAVVYCIIFALSPIFAPRYLFPAYIMFSLSLAQNKTTKTDSIKN